MEKPGITGDNRPRPVGGRWTTPCTACGASSGPQAVEIVRPPIHKRLSWPDRSWTAQPVDAIWTTPRSPGCGCKKVAGSVESDRNPADIRTAGVVGAAHGGPDRSGRSRLPGPEQASRPRGARPRGLVTASPTASPATTASGRPSAKPTAVRPSADRPQAIRTGTVQAPASRRTSGAVTSGADSSVQSAACGQPRRAVGRGATASTPCGRSGPRLARPSPSRDVRVRAGPRRRAAAGGPATARTPISPHAAGAGTRRAPAGPRPGAPAVAHGLRAARVSRS